MFNIGPLLQSLPYMNIGFYFMKFLECSSMYCSVLIKLQKIIFILKTFLGVVSAKRKIKITRKNMQSRKYTTNFYMLYVSIKSTEVREVV